MDIQIYMDDVVSDGSNPTCSKEGHAPHALQILSPTQSVWINLQVMCARLVRLKAGNNAKSRSRGREGISASIYREYYTDLQ